MLLTVDNGLKTKPYPSQQTGHFSFLCVCLMHILEEVDSLVRRYRTKRSLSPPGKINANWKMILKVVFFTRYCSKFRGQG